MREHGGGRQGGAGSVLYLDPSASYMGFQIRENSTIIHEISAFH